MQTWKNERKKSSFLLAVPRSKQLPHVSRMLQTRRMRKKSLGWSKGLILPGIGVPFADNVSEGLIWGRRRRTVTKSDDAVHRIKDDRRVHHLVVIELAKVLHLRDPLLAHFEVVLLKAKRDTLKKVVKNSNNKVLMISVESPNEDGEEVDVAILDLPWFREDLL